ncbi:hypothetical protein EI94DRAFT_897349 [Lactarius quietus]|nr:hypothetical protein EI94DRAFT_897349 [Lactarius quietus]
MVPFAKNTRSRNPYHVPFTTRYTVNEHRMDSGTDIQTEHQISDWSLSRSLCDRGESKRIAHREEANRRRDQCAKRYITLFLPAHFSYSIFTNLEVKVPGFRKEIRASDIVQRGTLSCASKKGICTIWTLDTSRHQMVNNLFYPPTQHLWTFRRGESHMAILHSMRASSAYQEVVDS